MYQASVVCAPPKKKKKYAEDAVLTYLMQTKEGSRSIFLTKTKE